MNLKVSRKTEGPLTSLGCSAYSSPYLSSYQVFDHFFFYFEYNFSYNLKKESVKKPKTKVNATKYSFPSTLLEKKI